MYNGPMRRFRVLPFLILCCVLDLAIPVEPTPTGVEFEDEEEALHVAAPRTVKPQGSVPHTPALGADIRARIRLIVRHVRPTADRSAQAAPVRSGDTGSDRSVSSSAPSEDH